MFPHCSSVWFHNRTSRSIGLFTYCHYFPSKANKQSKSPSWVIAGCALLKQNFGSKINSGVILVPGVLFIYWKKSNEQNGLLVSWGETLSSLKWALDLPNDLLLAQLDARQAHLNLCWPFSPPQAACPATIFRTLCHRDSPVASKTLALARAEVLYKCCGGKLPSTLPWL